MSQEVELTQAEIPSDLAASLRSQPETGMGYWVVRVKLRDGREYPRVAIVEGQVVEVFGHDDIPFDPADVVELSVTHDRWQFGKQLR